MKTRFLAAFLPAAILAIPGGLALRAAQQAAQPAKVGEASTASAPAKDADPLPQVPRITSEEVTRLLKDKASVVLVDTDDPEAYAAEHIKGAVNIAYDPTTEMRDRDQTLSALPGDRLIVFYCNCVHEEDSAPFVLEMWDLGYDHDKVKVLRGGLSRWEQLHYPLAGSEVDATREKGN